jgi:hypothetical protein
MSPRNIDSDEVEHLDDERRDRDRVMPDADIRDREAEAETRNDRDGDGLPDKPAAYRVPS